MVAQSLSRTGLENYVKEPVFPKYAIAIDFVMIVHHAITHLVEVQLVTSIGSKAYNRFYGPHHRALRYPVIS